MVVDSGNSMTQPRQVIPGMIVMVTRRTLRRHFLLSPDKTTSGIFTYLLAVMAEKYNIVVHAVCVVSTHYHIVLTDTRGELPDFLRDFNRLSALAMKVHRKWEGSLWDQEEPSVVQLKTPEAIVEKIAYVMANPTDIGAIYYAKDWPGLNTTMKELGKAQKKAKRPEIYFDPTNEEWPDEATLRYQIPEGLEEHLDDPMGLIEEEYERLQQDARKRLRSEGKGFLGVKKVLSTSAYKRATSWESIRELNPTFAVGRGQSKAKRLAVEALRLFRATYRAALELWRAGKRRAEFPKGTWWMVTFHGAVVCDSG